MFYEYVGQHNPGFHHFSFLQDDHSLSRRSGRNKRHDITRHRFDVGGDDDDDDGSDVSRRHFDDIDSRRNFQERTNAIKMAIQKVRFKNQNLTNYT